MTSHDPNLLKRTFTGIRNIGLDSSTRTKMMRIARDYTMGKKRKKLIVFLIAVVGVSGLGYGVYQGMSGSSSPSGHSQSIATAKTDFKVPAWMGGEGKPKNVSLGKNIARNDFKSVAKYKAKKSSAKKGKHYAKKHKGKKSKYAKHHKNSKHKYAKGKKHSKHKYAKKSGKHKKHLASKKKKKSKRGSHLAKR